MDFAAKEVGPGWVQPSSVESGLERYDGVKYAVLRDSGGIHSVYRVDNGEEGTEEFSLVEPEDYPDELMEDQAEIADIQTGDPCLN
jgi:hypothetical protein